MRACEPRRLLKKIVQYGKSTEVRRMIISQAGYPKGDVPSEATRAGNHHTNRVVRATLRPGSRRAGPRQAEEGHIPPTADGPKREDTVASPTASCYPLRESQTHSRWRGTVTGPSVRPATSPTKGSATRTGSRHNITREGEVRRCRQWLSSC